MYDHVRVVRVTGSASSGLAIGKIAGNPAFLEPKGLLLLVNLDFGRMLLHKAVRLVDVR